MTALVETERPQTTAAVAASLKDVTHRYGKTVALDSVTLEVPGGCMAGLIGPDGVGKSTLLGLVAGVRKIQTGEVRALDGDLKDAAFRQGAYARIARRRRSGRRASTILRARRASIRSSSGPPGSSQAA